MPNVLPFLFALQIAHAADCNPKLGLVADLGAAVAQAPSVVSQVRPEQFTAQGLRAEVLSLALRAWQEAYERGDTRKTTLTIIDYSLPSDQKRLWVIDIATGKLLFHELVAHGRGSGDRVASAFANKDASLKSNLGLLKTGETYDGKHGYSLRLDGLEPGFNDNARDRGIVMHAADYVNDDLARREHRIGRSWGCPAVDPKVSKKLIDTIQGGSLVFGYYPDKKWLEGSAYLR